MKFVRGCGHAWGFAMPQRRLSKPEDWATALIRDYPHKSAVDPPHPPSGQLNHRQISRTLRPVVTAAYDQVAACPSPKEKPALHRKLASRTKRLNLFNA